MNDAQKILHEFNRQHDRVLDAIAAGRFATSVGLSAGRCVDDAGAHRVPGCPDAVTPSVEGRPR